MMNPLFAVRDNGRAGSFEALDRIANGHRAKKLELLIVGRAIGQRLH